MGSVPEGNGGSWVQSGQEATGRAAGAARESVAQVGERAQDLTHQATSGVREQTEGNPLAAGLVAFGVGWLVSSLMPASQPETQAAQRAGELAREHGGPVLEQAKQVAQDVGQELQGSAQEAAAHVKERAADAAGSVREEAQSSVSG